MRTKNNQKKNLAELRKNAESFQGTGLGLNIVQKFVSIMNGTISFTSKEDQGATFVMTFPKM